MATATPPAPKSLHRLMSRAASGFRNSRWSLRSSGALPFCTSAPQCASESRECALAGPRRPAAAVPAGLFRRAGGRRPPPPVLRGVRFSPEPRRPPRQSPFVWRESRRDKSRPQAPWRGRFGCRTRCNRPRRSYTIFRCGSFPGGVSPYGLRGSAAPVSRIA